MDGARTERVILVEQVLAVRGAFRVLREVVLAFDTAVGRGETDMNAADVLLLTSDSEGSPNSVKEALACDLPVVALDVGDVRERLAGVDPSRVATDDAELVEGLVDVLRREERSNGREAAREVSIERTADRMLDVYETVAGEPVTTRPAREAPELE